MRSLLAYGDNNATVEEKVTLRIKADNNGDVYVPVAGYSSDGTQNCKYSWMISIDGGTANNYSGTGGVSGIRVGYGLTPLSVHTVTIKPKVEEYGWLRAFGYRGTNYAPYLINIISDKSYKGYALSALFTGDWYKAYQYYGCTNLINTDEELLPNTLEIIGNNYRYYEYAGCTSLVGNAEEKILKTVKAIGDNYRAYQYQNCTGLKRVDMRAINWASVGNNYRYNQYSGIATEKKPVTIYIEGGIEEGGSWGLSDTRVKDIYVYYGLVADYKAKLSGITETKIKKYDKWDVLEYEFIEFIAKADGSGNIRIPVGGYGTGGAQNCAYDWMVSIDGGEAEEITGTGSATYVSVGSGLTEGTEHRIVIKPKTVSYGWGRAFGYYGTGAEGYIKEIIHDSYKCYASSRTATGNYYKYRTYCGCTSLVNSYEKLPTSVTTVGASYMKECCKGCVALTTAFWEIMHKGCSIGTDYRKEGYRGCTSLSKHQGMAGYVGDTYPSGYKDSYLLSSGTNLELYISRLERMYTLDVAEGTAYYGGTMDLATITRAGRYIFSGNLVGTSSNTWFDVQIWKNNTMLWAGSAPDPGTEPVKFEVSCQVGDVIQIRAGYEQRYGRLDTMKLEFSNVLGLDNNRVKGVYVYVDDLYNYGGNNAWSDLTSTKFQVYYFDYQPLDTVDITKYTKLVGTYGMPSRSSSSSSGYSIGGFDDWRRGVAPYSKDSYYVRVPGEAYVLNTGRVLGNIYTVRWQGATGTALDTSSSFDVSTGSGGQIDGNVKGFYVDYKGNVIYATAWKSSNSSVYRECSGRVSQTVNASYDGWSPCICASRDGRYCWWDGNRYYAPTKWGSATVSYGGGGGNYTNMEFSDDGMTAYVASNFGTITQYNLKAPRDLTNMTSAGKTKSVSGNFAFSKDFKYLYVYNGSLTVYEYQS